MLSSCAFVQRTYCLLAMYICCRGCTYTVQPAKVVKSGLILHELAMLQRLYFYPFCRACCLLVQCDNKNSHTPNIFAILYYSPNKSDSMRRMYPLCFFISFILCCMYISKHTLFTMSWLCCRGCTLYNCKGGEIMDVCYMSRHGCRGCTYNVQPVKEVKSWMYFT